MDDKIKALEEQIKKEKQRVRAVEEAKRNLPKLEDISDEHKIETFDTLFKMQEDDIKHLLLHGHNQKHN